MRSILTLRRSLATLAAVVALSATAGCGDDDEASADGSDRPTIVVTTTILGDIVEHVVGDQAEVEVLLPRGADPHEASVSAREADTMSEADLVVANGAGFEEAIADVLTAVEADGTPVFAFADHVDLLTYGDTHGRVADDDEHDASDADPHIWTDPSRMAGAAQALGDRVAELDGVDASAVERTTREYVDAVQALDAEIETLLAPIPDDDRVLVTNHEAFGYFADRYGFEVVGAVIPSGTTQAEPSSAAIDDLAEIIRDRGVPAIFAETTQSTNLADALAASVGGVEVVTLFTESLGDEGSGAETYIDLMRTDAELVAGALG